MKHYKDEFGVGIVYFLDGHKEFIEEVSMDDDGGKITFMAETNVYPFKERYICIERVEEIPTELNSAGYFQVKRTTFWKYDSSRISKQVYISGEVLIDDSNVWVRAPIARIELYEN